jgi:hypothetical protein
VVTRSQLQPRPRRLYPGVALLISMAGTLGTWSLLAFSLGEESRMDWIAAAGAVLGPNAGHWYQGTIATRGTAARALGALGLMYGVHWLRDFSLDDDDSPLPPLASLAAGTALCLIGTLDDLVDAPLRAWRRNKRLDSLVLTPTINDRSAGFTLGGRF